MTLKHEPALPSMQWAASIKGLRAAATTTYDSLNRPLTVTSPFKNPDQSVTSQTPTTSYQGYIAKWSSGTRGRMPVARRGERD